jgi:hypothetical protein
LPLTRSAIGAKVADAPSEVRDRREHDRQGRTKTKGHTTPIYAAGQA